MRLILIALLMAISYAQTDEENVGVIYGEDHRMDYYQFVNKNGASHPLSKLARESIVNLMFDYTVQGPNANGEYTLDRSVGNLAQNQNLCPDQRFRKHYNFGFCSGTLVGPKTVITAGHCFDKASDCSSTRIVFNHYLVGESSNGEPQYQTIGTDDVYKCVDFKKKLGTEGGLEQDWMYIILDREVPGSSGHRPIAVETRRVARTKGEDIAMVGFPDGIALKIEDGGKVSNARGNTMDFFEASTDSFRGNSGSGVFTEDGSKMIGILVRGADDYRPRNNADCKEVNTLDMNHHDAEDINYVFWALPPSLAGGNGGSNGGSNSNGGNGGSNGGSNSNGGNGGSNGGSNSNGGNGGSNGGSNSNGGNGGSNGGSCVEVSIITKADKYPDEMSWIITNDCQMKNDEITAEGGTLSKKCCLSPGRHTLTCMDTAPDGWAYEGVQGFLTIEGTKHCAEDFTGAEKKVTFEVKATQTPPAPVIPENGGGNKPGWAVISETKACEWNDEGIRRFFGNKGHRTLELCKKRCEETSRCVAIDYYAGTGYCNLFDRACTTPKRSKDGSSSHKRTDKNSIQYYSYDVLLEGSYYGLAILGFAFTLATAIKLCHNKTTYTSIEDGEQV